MMTGARNRAHMDYDTNPGGFQNWFWYLPFADEDVAEEQVNELDKATLASYVKKAAPDRYNRIPNDLMQMKDAEKNRRQWVNRDKGISQALDKLSKDNVKEESQLQEKQDACYNKVKSRYKVWPSAYASGALVQCRKKGAANWGNKTKK